MEPQKRSGDDDDEEEEEEARRRETERILCIVRVDMAQERAGGLSEESGGAGRDSR